MKIYPERSGRRPGEEALPRGEITTAAHDVAKLVARLDDGSLARLRQRGTTMHWIDYGRFTVSVQDAEAPASLYGRAFTADFENERFVQTDMHRHTSWLHSIGETFGIGLGKDWHARMLRNGEPATDESAEELLDYLETGVR